MRYLILAREPASPEGVPDFPDPIWSIALQTNSADHALDFWKELPNDPSDRIMLDTEQFITFAPGESNA